MDFWTLILIFAFMTGVMGWCITPFVNAVLWFCDWKDGAELDWGIEVAFTLAVPFAYFFSIMEIYVLYCK